MAVMDQPSHPLVEPLRKAYEAMVRGEFEPMRRLFWPDCVLHIPGATPLSGEIHGWDEAVKWAAKTFERGGRTYSEDIISIVASDRWAFMFTTYRAEREGRKVEDRCVNVYRLRDGRVAEMWVLVGDERAFNKIYG